MDETGVISGTWVAHPRVKKEVASQLIFVSQGADSSRRGLVQAQYDFKMHALAEKEPILLVQESLSPTNLAMHPTGDGVVISSKRGCKLFCWDQKASQGRRKDKAEYADLELIPSETVLSDLEDAGPQSCLKFNRDGALLATGGEDGCVRVFRWPSLEMVLDVPKVSKQPVKDLDFSLDSSLLSVISENNGSCRIWDLSTGEHVATLAPTKGEKFGFCRFSQDAPRAFLFVSVTKDGKGCLSVWDIFKWKKIGAKPFLKDPITALAVTHHGKRVAMGSEGGEICVVLMKNMQVEQRFKKAHNHAVKVLEFSLNDKALLSVASDCTSRVTELDLSKDWKDWQVYLLLIGFVVITAIFFFGLNFGWEEDSGLPRGTSKLKMPSNEFFLTNLFKKGDSGHDEL